MGREATSRRVLHTAERRCRTPESWGHTCTHSIFSGFFCGDRVNKTICIQRVGVVHTFFFFFFTFVCWSTHPKYENSRQSPPPTPREKRQVQRQDEGNASALRHAVNFSVVVGSGNGMIMAARPRNGNRVGWEPFVSRRDENFGITKAATGRVGKQQRTGIKSWTGTGRDRPVSFPTVFSDPTFTVRLLKNRPCAP